MGTTSRDQQGIEVSPEMLKLERTKMWLGMTKFVLGTVVVGLISLAVSTSLKQRELQMMALEKENKQLEMFMSLAIRPPEERRAFALYFSTLARDEKLKEAWQSYLAIAEAEIRLAEVRKREQLERAGATAEDVAKAVAADLKSDDSLLRKMWQDAVSRGQESKSSSSTEH